MDLDPLLAEVGESTRALAESRGVSLEVEPTSVGTATLDPDQIRQVLDNLLRNAIEATPAGGVVTLAAQRAGDGVVITVSDTGAGIEPDHLPRIFDLYFTTKAGGDRDRAGRHVTRSSPPTGAPWTSNRARARGRG